MFCLPKHRLADLRPPLLFALALGSLAALPASAQVVQYSSISTFDSAAFGSPGFAVAPQNQLFSFSIPHDPRNNFGRFYDYGSIYSVDGLTFNQPDNPNIEEIAADSTLFGGTPRGNPFGGADYLSNFGRITVVLPAGTTAFGAYFANYISTDSATFTATVNGQSFSFVAPGTQTNTSAFAGFVSNTPITSLTFSGQTQNIAIGNINYGPVPEASTTVSFGLLLTLGLGVAVAARKRKAIA